MNGFRSSSALVDDAVRVLQMVCAINRAWQPTTKRVALRAETLAVKPERLAERIEEALTEPDPLAGAHRHDAASARCCRARAVRPNVDRARVWLAEALEILRR